MVPPPHPSSSISEVWRQEFRQPHLTERPVDAVAPTAAATASRVFEGVLDCKRVRLSQGFDERLRLVEILLPLGRTGSSSLGQDQLVDGISRRLGNQHEHPGAVEHGGRARAVDEPIQM